MSSAISKIFMVKEKKSSCEIMGTNSRAGEKPLQGFFGGLDSHRLHQIYPIERFFVVGRLAS